MYFWLTPARRAIRRVPKPRRLGNAAISQRMASQTQMSLVGSTSTSRAPSLSTTRTVPGARHFSSTMSGTSGRQTAGSILGGLRKTMGSMGITSSQRAASTGGTMRIVRTGPGVVRQR